MANFNNLALTASGTNALLAAQTGTKLTLSKIGMGSGTTTGSAAGLTNLVTPELMMPITETNVDSVSGHMTLVAKMTNEGMEEGFYWRETGLFFEDADGNDVLFAYASITDDAYDYIPAYNDQRYVKMIRIANIITDSANIEIKEQGGLVYVDTLTFEAFKEEVKDHTDSTDNPHAVTAIQAGAVTALGFASPEATGHDTLLAYLFELRNAGHIAVSLFVSGFSDLPRTDWQYGCIARLHGNIQVQIWRALSFGAEGLLFREVSNAGEWGGNWTTSFLPLAGGTLTGDLLVNKGNPSVDMKNNTGTTGGMYLQEDYNLTMRILVNSLARGFSIKANNDLNNMFRVVADGASYNIYGRHNKSLALFDLLGVQEVQWVDELPADASDHSKVAYCILEG